MYVMYQCTDTTAVLHLHRSKVPIQRQLHSTSWSVLRTDIFQEYIYLVMFCLYLLYFLDDKTVLISLENIETCLPYKFPLKYECLKVHKMWYMYFVSQGKSNKNIIILHFKIHKQISEQQNILKFVISCLPLCSLIEVSVHSFW